MTLLKVLTRTGFHTHLAREESNQILCGRRIEWDPTKACSTCEARAKELGDEGTQVLNAWVNNTFNAACSEVVVRITK